MIKRKKCTVEGCNYPRFAKGLCNVHQYMREDKSVRSTKKRSYIKPVADKRAVELAKYRVERDKFLKGKTCQFPDCKSTNVECHHAKGREGSMVYKVEYFRALCRKHHNWVENNPEEAKRLGLSVDRLVNKEGA